MVFRKDPRFCTCGICFGKVTAVAMVQDDAVNRTYIYGLRPANHTLNIKDIFRRLTNPTLKKLYRFVLKRLIGRFLDNDIALEQIDVHLGAGRVELTDLTVNVRVLAELLPPDLSFRLARGHIGRLRVEISYSKLLTESLAVFLDDVLVEISPPVSNLNETHLKGVGVDATGQAPLVNGQGEGDVVDASQRAEGAAAALAGAKEKESSFADQQDQMGEAGERLDFLAQWIEQITSKVKVVVNKMTVGIASATSPLENSDSKERSSVMPYVELRCSSLRWCDETPEVSSFVADRNASAGIDPAERSGKANGARLVAHKRLTLGLMVAELTNSQTRKVEVLRIDGTGCVAIKHSRKPQLGPTSGDVALDVDISLRHAGVTLGTDECTDLCALVSEYRTRAEQPAVSLAKDVSPVSTKPVKPLFREDFWYFEGDGNISSSELNFDTLSRLLEQYADARARLAEAEGHGVFGASSYMSLGQSDIFFDCEEGSDDDVGGAGAGSDGHGSMKFRVRMTGLDVTLVLAEEPTLVPKNSGASTSVRFQARRMSQTWLCDGKWVHSVAEVGTIVTDWNDGSTRDGRYLRVVEVLKAADASPSVEISYTAGAQTRSEVNPVYGEDVALTVTCLPVAAVLDPRMVNSLSNFFAQIKVRPMQTVDGTNGRNSQTRAEPSTSSVRDSRVVVTLTLPELTVRIPADVSSLSSDAYAALVSSIQNDTSPVGWAQREEIAEDMAPMLVLQVEGVAIRIAFGSSTPQETALECERVACRLLLPGDNVARDDGIGSPIGLYFLEASRSSAEMPLKLEYGLAKDIRTAGQLNLARPGDADLNFLHTWEPNDGSVGSGLEDVAPPGSFGERLPGGGCGVGERDEPSPRVLLCVLPRLAVELSRLELVVLADVLAGVSPRRDHEAGASSEDCPSYADGASKSLEVVVEARGATIVLHEAAEFAEDPGPHSFVLNLGSACLHVGGSDKPVEGSPAPLMTVSAGDLCVHETLRCPLSRRPRTSGGGRVDGPLLFFPGKRFSACPMVEDLPALGFVPVLYQTKWAKGTSVVAAELALGVSEPGTVFKTITATLNLYDVSLRHTVASSWLPRLLGLVVGDVPAGSASSSTNSDADGGVGATGNGNTGGSLTKMFITVFNGVVDYMPQSQGSSCACGDAPGASIDVCLPTKGRAVFPIGVLRVSSNMVAGAAMQGFKVVIRDIGLHMSNRVMDYCKEDVGLCRGALESRRRSPVPPVKTDFSSVQEFLESSQFVQIATLNFLDAFLRIRSQVVAPSDAFTAVELWMGVVHVYTCQDSLNTCQALLGEWWTLVNAVPTAAAAAAADLDKAGVHPSKRQFERESRDETQQGVPTSLLDDVEQDAFLPGSTRGSSQVEEGKVDPDGAALVGKELPGQDRKQSLVIEDYYCVSVEPTNAQVAPESLLTDALGAPRLDGATDDPVPGPNSSLLSEVEGPAQWLAAPRVGLSHGDSLSMESADDTSESEGEEERRAHAVGSGLVRLGVDGRRRQFGFILPAPIEIELEDRCDAETSEARESGTTTGVPGTTEQALSSPEQDRWRSEGSDLSNQDEESVAGEFSPQRGASNQHERTPVDTPANPESLCRRDSLPFEDPKGFLNQATSASAGALPEAPDIEPATTLRATKLGHVQGEQEARWLGSDRETPSDSSGVAEIGATSSSHQPEDFRVYPHYVPIPTAAEASSLPFLTGDPLQALGHGLEKPHGGEAEVRGPEHIDQKLQFQLAIHDLSVCWRLFKGRDWIGRSTSEDERTSHQGVGEGSRHKRESTRDPSLLGVTEGKARRHERMHEDADASSTRGGVKPRKAELLDALVENYQDKREHGDEAQVGRRTSRQPRVKLLNLPRDSGSSRSGRRTGRDTSCMLEVVLEHSSLRLDNFHPGPPPSMLSNLLFSIKDLHASDTLTSSRPRKTLHHWRDDRRHPREFQHKMVTVRMTTRGPSDHFCPEDAPLGDEIMLKVRLLPIHLSFGQHTVDFLRSFSPQVQSSPSAHEQQSATSEQGAGPIFISCCDVGSFKVKIDYQPRAIKVGALQNGDYLELLNLFPLEGVHLTLQKLVLTGVSGWNGVAQLLLQSWVQDITSNQLHKFLAGTTAVRPLVTVGKGVADLVLLPVEQYRRDGRVLRGLRKGTQSFLRAITIETLHTSHRVASYISRTLDDIVTQPGAQASLRGLEYYDEQPTGVIDSLEHAYDALSKEMQVAAQTIIAIPYEDQEEVVGPHGRSYVRSVARALPVAVLRPVVGASEALSCTLLGFRNAMEPRMRKEEELRWS